MEVSGQAAQLPFPNLLICSLQMVIFSVFYHTQIIVLFWYFF